MKFLNNHPEEAIALLDLFDFQGQAYLKDKTGRYLACNHRVALDAGQESPRDIIDNFDEDLVWQAYAAELKRNDGIVYTTQKKQVFIEKLLITTKQKLTFKSYKFPIVTNNNRTIGVLGTSFVLSEKITPPFTLTTQEQNCVNLLLQGKSNKEIAGLLNISSKTVDQYFYQLKEKVNCKNKFELAIFFLNQEISKNKVSFYT